MVIVLYHRYLVKYISSSSTERSRTYSRVPNKTDRELFFFGSSSLLHFFTYYRAVGRSENPGVPVLFGGHNRPSLVLIGLTDTGTTPLSDKQNNISFIFFHLTNFKKVPTYTLIRNFKPRRVLAKSLIRAKLQSPNIANVIFSPSFMDFLMHNCCLCLLILFSDRNSFRYLDTRHKA